MDFRSTPRWSRRAALGAGLVLVLAAAGARAFDPAKTPATPVPANRWGALESRSILGDESAFRYDRDPKQNEPFWFDVDVENGWLFTPTGRGLQIYDLRTTPDNPPLTGYGYGPHPSSQGPGGLMPYWNHSDEDFFLVDVDVPAGLDSLAMVAGKDQGMVVWNTTAKNDPKVHYQDGFAFTKAVYTARLGGTLYGFGLTEGSGVVVYNLDVAKTFTKCGELPPNRADGQSCPGVYIGRLGGFSGPVGGEGIAGTGNFLAVGGINRTEIWSVANLGAPVRLINGTNSSYSVALWQSGGAHYLASVFGGNLNIYDVSCITSGPCALPAPLATRSVPAPAPVRGLTLSSSGGKNYLYVGKDEDTASCAVQREYLFDVSSPQGPLEVTPTTHPSGYWGWYYERCPTGFNWVSPRAAVFHGTNLYRAAYGLLDVHELANAQPPGVNFSWAPSDVYPGTPVDFTDLSTGSPTAWNWFFPDGSPTLSFDRNPQNVTFGSAGPKQVELTATNSAGPNSLVKTVNVLSPAPVVGSVGISPPTPKLCQPITFTANGAGGQPPLSIGWGITGPSSNNGSGNPYTWNTSVPPLPTPGNYSATVTVNNATGPAAQASAPFTIAALQPLPGGGFGGISCTNCTGGSPIAETATFAINIAGATEWRWDFDGNGYEDDPNSGELWTTDPIAGPNPTHTYNQAEVDQVCGGALPCTFNVRVKVRNCLEAERESATFQVRINQLVPLAGNFVAQCPFGFCSFTAGQAIAFQDFSTGAERWDYDWDGNGTFEDADRTSPAATHVYNSAGNFTPKLRVRRGATEQDVFTHQQTLIIDPAQPASISVNGPSSGLPSTPYTFSATAFNCTPAASGWSWATSGGTVNGASNNSSISISWSATGSKTVTAQNSACGSAQGNDSINISSGGPGPGPGPSGLGANFTYSPIPAEAGEPVSFNGASSTGAPTVYTWQWGDGTPNSNGVQASHTFASAGTYNVILEVGKEGSCPLGFCTASKTVAVQVIVSGPPPPQASFTSDAVCENEFGLILCRAETGSDVTFTDFSTGTIEARTWNFGDETTADTQVVTHRWRQPGTYSVSLTVSGAGTSSSAQLTFNVTGPAVSDQALLLTWFNKTTEGKLNHTSDFYAYNPGDEAMQLSVRFLKRGRPNPNAKTVTGTLQPGETKYVPDALGSLFGVSDAASGFLYFTFEGGGGVLPVITGINQTERQDGTSFGQAFPAVVIPRQSAGAATAAGTHHLIGLNDNLEATTTIGISNPFLGAAEIELGFFDAQGAQLHAPLRQTIAGNGQKQFVLGALRELGVGGDDYRVAVKNISGGPVFPYASQVRAGGDPSFIDASEGGSAKVYLVGVYSGVAAGGTLWGTDSVVFNPTDAPQQMKLSLTRLGPFGNAQALTPFTLQPGQSLRLRDVVEAKWNHSGAGVLTFEMTGKNGVFPVVIGERYDYSDPSEIYGNVFQPLTEDDSAGVGESIALIGLRHDDDFRTTIYFFNPDSIKSAVANVVFRAASDGRELARVGMGLSAGTMRNLTPAQIPAAVEAAGEPFTVVVEPTHGKLIAAAQVVADDTHDPRYVVGFAQ